MGDALTTKLRVTELVQRLRVLKDEKERLENCLREVNREARELQERTLPRLMEDGEIEKMTVIGAGTIYIKQDLFVSMAKDEDGEEAPFYDWARTHAPDLIADYIHPARLKSWAKECLENGKPLPDNMIRASFVPMATLLRR
jgi:hypothetical protein